MTYVAPITFVAGNMLTAAQMNAIQANILETAVAKATAGGASGALFVPTAANAIAQRIIGMTEVLTAESTSSTSYTALATAQAVTVTTGTQALVLFGAQMTNATLGNRATMSYAVSGASTFGANDNWGLLYEPFASNMFVGMSRHYWHTGLTAGSNTFTCQFKSSAATAANFRSRQIVVIPF